MKTILQLIDEFTASIDRADCTISHYKKVLRYWAHSPATDLKAKTIKDITAMDLLRFKRYMTEIRTVAPSSLSNYMAVLKTFFEWTVYLKYIEVSPAQNIKTAARRSEFVRASLSSDQVRQLLKVNQGETAIQKRNAAIIALMVFTGVRCIEVSRTNNKSLFFASGAWYMSIQRKGHTSEDATILVPDWVARLINDYLAVKENSENPDAPMFTNHGRHNTDGRISAKYTGQMVKASIIKTGINDRRFSAHSLRHTATVLAHDAGATPEELNRMLGHKSMAQTYAYMRSLQLRTGIQDQAIKKLDIYWSNLKKNKAKPHARNP